MTRWILAVAPLVLAACGQPQPAQDQDPQIAAITAAAKVKVTRPWVRDSAGRTANAAVFMTITAPAGDRLTGASSSVADKTDLMTMKTEDGAMGMAYVERIDLPPGQTVSLDPMGLHIWLEDLKRPLQAGEKFNVTLKFEKAGSRDVAVSVINPAGRPPS